MTKRNPYLQHTYESFDQPSAPRRPGREEGITDKLLNSGLGAKLRSPLFATAALLLTGAAFAGIIIASYPDSDQPDGNIPVVTADASPLRDAPTDVGGLDVAHEDSTIYGTVRSAELQETAPIENLLAEAQPVDTQTALVDPAQPPADAALAPVPAAEKPAEAATTPPSEMADATAAAKPAAVEPAAGEEKVAEVRKIPMKTETSPAIAPAASTPETLEYVRSVLDKKDADPSGTKTAAIEPSPEPEELAAIEPTSGAAIGAGSAIKPGNSFIQLASISAESAAPKEWAKLQKAHPSLSGAEYRVQRADLGAKGVFFRIQAGPMSKDSAKSICDGIKVSKPGGCIIVQ